MRGDYLSWEKHLFLGSILKYSRRGEMFKGFVGRVDEANRLCQINFFILKVGKNP